MFDEVNDDDDDELPEPDEPLISESALYTTTSKEKDVENKKYRKRLIQVKKFLNKLLMQFVWKMHKLSRKFSYVLKVLQQERKLLNGPLNTDLNKMEFSM